MDSENAKQIYKCRELSNSFWDCMVTNKDMKNVPLNCGKEYYILVNCMKKIK
jgi:hypothetical protein